MLTSIAQVNTDNPARYAKQLCEHLGRRSTYEYADGEGRIDLNSGTVVLHSGDGVLELTASAEDAESLAQVQDVAGRHLERFGQRNELAVNWEPATESA